MYIRTNLHVHTKCMNEMRVCNLTHACKKTPCYAILLTHNADLTSIQTLVCGTFFSPVSSLCSYSLAQKRTCLHFTFTMRPYRLGAIDSFKGFLGQSTTLLQG